MKKKILALCLVVVLVATAITGATLAYFTDRSEIVTNTFTVGDVQIKLDEAKVNPETGIAPNHDDRVLMNEYKDIYPGQKMDKDPTVTIMANSEPSYVRAKVTVNAADLKAAFPEFDDDGLFLLEKLVEGWDKAVWPVASVVTNQDGTVTYEFRYASVTEEKTVDYALKDLFTMVVIPADATSADLKALVGEDGSFAFNIVAEAIQAAGFDNADAAWAAFDKIEDPKSAPFDPVPETTESNPDDLDYELR